MFRTTMTGFTQKLCGTVLLLVSFGACTPAADAEVLLEILPFAAGDDALFRDPKAWLEVQGEAGSPAELVVIHGDNENIRVKSPLPIPCAEGGRCALQFSMRPQKATFRLRIEAGDRCGNRFDVVHFESITKTLRPYDSNEISFLEPDYDLDEDGDAIVNYAEFLLCGRPDWDEMGVPPAQCVAADDPCCAQIFAYEGEMVNFAGGNHMLADGREVSVAPFWLDATEVTWRQLKRCVAAGACLPDNPEHPVRLRMDQVNDLRLPVTGLNPAEAANLCAFFGKRLVRDDEFDFAAAHRDGDTDRARFPWDEDSNDIDCRPGDADSGVAANHSAPGASCPGLPLPVGSYPSSYAYRGPNAGTGTPVVDLAGNVSEWTVATAEEIATSGFSDDVNRTIEQVPAGVANVFLRGGGWHSPAILLENDVRVEIPNSDSWADQIDRLTEIAGFRCAVDETSYIGKEPEPACGALE